MHRLDSDVTAFLLKLSHDKPRGGAVPRLISDYESVSFQLDSIHAEDVVFTDQSGSPLLVVDPCLALHLETRPLVMRRQGRGYFLALANRRRSERLQLQSL